MVDVTSIPQMQTLFAEQQAIEQALASFDRGGRIISMMVSAAADDPKYPVAPAVSVPTREIQYPPQMVDAIKTALSARYDAITKELSDLGITSNAQRKKGK